MNTDRELTQTELRDDDLEHVVGGSITRKIDASSPKLFEMACSGTAFKG
jgi:type VI protein secretion system component Hcp